MATKPKEIDVWMPLYISKYLGRTMTLNTEQHGAYLLLLMAAWKLDGKLPNDPEQLQAITRLPPARWKAHERILSSFFFVTEDFWINDKVREELEKAKNNSKKRAEAGTKGAANRWQKYREDIAN